jgi:hypothetical protein
MTPEMLITCLGTLLTLFGLLISLFSIHLGTWLGQLTSLKTKWELNAGSREESIAARREVRYELKGLYTHVPFLLTFIIVGFALGVLWFAWTNWSLIVDKTPLGFAVLFFGFFVVMFCVTIYLLIRGAVIGRDLRQRIDAEQIAH